MSVEEMQDYRDLILENIEYDHLCREFSTYRGGSGRDRGADCGNGLRQEKDNPDCRGQTFPMRLCGPGSLKLDSSHIEFVMECLHNNSTEIRNMKQYLLTVFNAPYHHEQPLHGSGKSRLLHASGW